MDPELAAQLAALATRPIIPAHGMTEAMAGDVEKDGRNWERFRQAVVLAGSAMRRTSSRVETGTKRMSSLTVWSWSTLNPART